MAGRPRKTAKDNDETPVEKSVVPEGQSFPTTLYHAEKPARHIVGENQYKAAIADGFQDLKDMPDEARQVAWEREANPGASFPMRRK